MHISFITPAFKRVDLTAICLEQRLQVMEALAERGIESSSVIVADDENLEVASGLGMHALVAPNQLGRRFNDGIEWACTQLGSDYVCLIGSDQWVHPDYFSCLDGLGDRIASGADFTMVNETGTEMVSIHGTYVGFVGPRVWPRSLLARVGFRPAEDQLMQGLDDSIARGVACTMRHPDKPWRDAGRDHLPWVCHDLPEIGPLRYVDFKTEGCQIHSYSHPIFKKFVTGENGIVGVFDNDPWGALGRAYPVGLVDRMCGLYEERRAIGAHT